MPTATAGRIRRLSELVNEPSAFDGWDRRIELAHHLGGDVKAVGNPGSGRVGGLAVKFHSPDRTQWRDWFHDKTDFGRFIQGRIPLLYHHSIADETGHAVDDELGDVLLAATAEGLSVDGRLSLATAEGRSLYGTVKASKAYWSSGAVSHRIKRVEQPDGTHRLDRWQIVECSLTDCPADFGAVAHAITSQTPIKYLPEPERSRLLAQLAEGARKCRELDRSFHRRQVAELLGRLGRAGVRT